MPQLRLVNKAFWSFPERGVYNIVCMLQSFYMKQTRVFSIFYFAIITFISPLFVFAGDGVSSWLRQGKGLSAKIAELPDEVVEDLRIPVISAITQKSLSDNFGDIRSGGRRHEGLDIMAPRGTPIVTPTEAVVLRVSTGVSAGKHVYTANPGGETFAYMHLDEFADIDEGDVLEEGDLIGFVGSTGNASKSSPHLHFEIRTENGPIDPYVRLTKVYSPEEKIALLEDIMGDIPHLELAEEKVVDSAPVKLVSDLPLKDLKLGAKGADVVALQKFLIKAGVGSAGRMVPDGDFGPLTEKALAEYQASVGIKPAVGYYGAITRAHLAKGI